MINGARRMSCTVGPAGAGLALSAFLSARFSYHTPEEWAALAGAGALLVNGEAAAPGRTLAAGDDVLYVPPYRPEPRVDREVKVLYEDACIMAVSKPGNLPAHPGGRYFRNTLWGVLKDDLDLAEPDIINRLDRETSGVTLVAKNRRAAAACRAQFEARSVVKFYTAFAEGDFEGPVRARGYIVPCSGSAIRKKRLFVPSASAGPEPGREADWADTALKPLRSAGGLTELDVRPYTGRLHQIRATLLALGRPLAGDKMYGLDEGIFLRFLADAMTSEDLARLRLGRQALHARELRFRHPEDGRPMRIEAPLPGDLAALRYGD